MAPGRRGLWPSHWLAPLDQGMQCHKRMKQWGRNLLVSRVRMLGRKGHPNMQQKTSRESLSCDFFGMFLSTSYIRKINSISSKMPIFLKSSHQSHLQLPVHSHVITPPPKKKRFYMCHGQKSLYWGWSSHL